LSIIRWCTLNKDVPSKILTSGLINYQRGSLLRPKIRTWCGKSSNKEDLLQKEDLMALAIKVASTT